MPMTPKQMICLLKQHGFVLVNSNGSHHKFYNPTTNRSTTVPYHAKDLKPVQKKRYLDKPELKSKNEIIVDSHSETAKHCIELFYKSQTNNVGLLS